MRRLSIIPICLLAFISCVSVTHLKSPDYETNANKNHFPLKDLFYFNSAKSEKVGSSVEVGAWLFALDGKQKYCRLDIKITNNTGAAVVSPENIELFDAKNSTLRLLSPADAVYLAHGQTSTSALASASAFQSAASMYSYSNPSPVNSFTYGSIYQTTPTSYTYAGSSYYQQQPNYAASMMGAMAMGMAIEAAEIQNEIAINNLLALRPIKLRPGSEHHGRIFSLIGPEPLELVITVAGDEHKIILEKNKNTAGDRGGSMSRYPRKASREN